MEVLPDHSSRFLAWELTVGFPLFPLIFALSGQIEGVADWLYLYADVIQYDVVLVDGTITVANQCQNTDLFWAMRGGGGVFAIAYTTYLKAWPAFTAINAVAGAATANSTETYNKMITAIVENDSTYMQNFTSGIYETEFPSVGFSFQRAFTDNSSIISVNESATLLDFLFNMPGVNTTVHMGQFTTWNQAYNAVVGPQVNSAVGVNLLISSRIISQEVMGSAAMANFITSLPQTQPIIIQRGRHYYGQIETLARNLTDMCLTVGGGVVTQLATDAVRRSSLTTARKSLANKIQTAVNPAFRTSAGFYDLPVINHVDGPPSALQNATIDNVTASGNQVFGEQAYYNEENRREPNFQTTLWGSNYQRLLNIKMSVDPNGVLTGSNTVGSEIFGT